MKLLAIAEHFPSPYKPYHYTQFEAFLSDGHELVVYAFDRHDGGAGAAGEERDFVRATRYLPSTLRDLPKFLGQFLGTLCLHPIRASRQLIRAASYPASLKHRLMNVTRAVLLPLEAPDVCIVHNLRAAANLRFLRAIYPGTVASIYYHGGELPGVPVPPADAIRDTFRSFDVVFTNTQSSRQHAIDRGQASERIVISQVGYDFRAFPDPRERPYRRDGRFNVLMAGRLSKEKGFLLGLQALKALLDEGQQDIVMRIVGDGPQRQQLTSFIAENGLERHVELLGRADQHEMKRRFTEADVLLLPSIPAGTWEENQACVIQEALLMRAVAAVSRTGGVCESTAPAMLPYSFETGSVPAIVTSLRSLSRLSAEELRELGAQGRAFVEGRYEIRTLNRQLLDTALAFRRGELPATTVSASA